MEIKTSYITIPNSITGIIDSGYFISKFKDNSILKDMNKDIKIILVNENINDYNLTVSEYIKFKILSKHNTFKGYEKKLNDSLKLIGFSDEYKNRKLSGLSYSELKYIAIINSLIDNPDVLVLENFFIGLDISNIKKVFKILKKIVDKYKKNVIIFTNDVDFIYKYIEDIVVFSGEDILLKGKTSDILENSWEVLINNKISVPSSIEFINKVRKNKNIKLNYNKDIRDLIKDIYKKV